jgi:peptidoglycan/xylan/chitin deacetylase (PgdA/CDA1 family)
LILMYHRVANVSSDPLELCVAPERFGEQLRLLQTVGEIVPLARLVAESPRNGPMVAITFDDGYADNALQAAPLLKEHDAHATVFVVAGAVGSRSPFWWDRLAALVSREEYWPHWERLRRLPAERIEEEVSALERGRTGAQVDPGARPVSEDELAALDAGPVEIGAHTLTHPSLPSFGERERRREIAGSRDRLAELLGRPPDAFAYPYGDYDRATVRLVEQSGFRLACTIHENRVSRLSSRLQLPRYAVRDWPADELERRLAGWVRGA